MSQRYLISMTACNRPGVLAVITNSLAELGGNTLELKQSLVFDHISLLASIDFPDHRAENVIVDHLLSAGQSFDLEVVLKSLPEEKPESNFNSDGYRAFLKIHGTDKPGVVRKICSIMGKQLIDIRDFYAVGDEGKETFSMAAELLIPNRTNYEHVETELQNLAKENGFEASLHRIEKDRDRETSTLWPQNVNLLVEQLQKS